MTKCDFCGTELQRTGAESSSNILTCPVCGRDVQVETSSEPAPSDKPVLWITQLSTGEKISLIAEGTQTIGRESYGEEIFQNLAISRKHCNIDYADAGFYICDLGSTNGTFLDGIRLKSRVLLEDGQHLVLANEEFLVEIKLPELRDSAGETIARKSVYRCHSCGRETEYIDSSELPPMCPDCGHMTELP
ncbi:MAG TPA: FHA domain-containing protein [Candidatus Cloacimonadota bacterium]|nr:FHA domain-containing protein [Candidatus Cloacimonadota bacterium]